MQQFLITNMLFLLLCGFLLINSASARYTHRYTDLEDAEDKQLFRAAYDTPPYDQHDYEEDDDLAPGKLDLLKDSMWVIKTKIKQLKAFDKALAANLLSTNLKLKDLLENHLSEIKNHRHDEAKEKKKPTHKVQPHHQQHYEEQYTPQYAHDPYYGH